MANANAQEQATSAWSGGTFPYAVPSKKLGMWLFIVSDSMTFSALIIGYAYVRAATPEWPQPFHFWPGIALASLMTFCLLSSSVTMAMGVGAAKKGDVKGTVRMILLTMLGGLLFILLHLNEWMNLINEGVRLWQNPWGVPLFGATFFTLTGLHMLHVASGIVYLAVVAVCFSKGRFDDEQVEMSGLYWHFVDLVWMFIFPMVYLLSVKL